MLGWCCTADHPIPPPARKGRIMFNLRIYKAGYTDAAEIWASEPMPRDGAALLRAAYRDLPDSMAVSEYEVGMRTFAEHHGVDLTTGATLEHLQPTGGAS